MPTVGIVGSASKYDFGSVSSVPLLHLSGRLSRSPTFSEANVRNPLGYLTDCF